MRHIILGMIFFSFIFSGCSTESGGNTENNTTLQEQSDSDNLEQPIGEESATETVETSEVESDAELIENDVLDQLLDESDTVEVIGSIVYLLEKSESDTNMDGLVDQKITYTYNTNNDKKMAQTVTIESGEESVIETVRYLYDSQNRLATKATYDEDGDIIDSFQVFYTDNYISKTITTSTSQYSEVADTYTYDSNGNELTKEYKYTYNSSTFLDNTTHYLETYNYNELGKPIHTVYQEINDDGAKGKEVIIERYTYDTQGRKATRQYDYDEDGIFDYVEYSYEYDSNGNIIKYFFDDETTVNNSAVYVYLNGKPINLTYYDSAGAPITVMTRTYDDGGNILTRTYDYENDGIIDNEYSLVYDQQGNLTSQKNVSISYSGEELFEYYTYEYDENNLLSKETYSENAHGIPESETWHTWMEIAK